MPFEVKYSDGLPAGYAAESAVKGGTTRIIVREFTSTEDGPLFISRLEGLPSIVLDLLPVRIKPSQIDHLLALIRKDGSATVYVNELTIKVRIRSRKSIDAGSGVLESDIADIDNLQFEGVEIPDDAGIIFIFSYGWRKGLFFDLAPFHGEGKKRQFDLFSHLGGCYAELAYQHLFLMSDEDWALMIEQGWFPFISLKSDTVRQLISRCREKGDTNEVIEQIKRDVDEMLKDRMDGWSKNPVLKKHLQFIQKAVEEYAEGDYMSATSVLFQRLEGMMMDHVFSLNPDAGRAQLKQEKLAEYVATGRGYDKNNTSLLLPYRFREYLLGFFFKNYDHKNPKGLTRNTVQHGVAPAQEFDLKSTLLTFLILDQLSFFIASAGAED